MFVFITMHVLMIFLDFWWVTYALTLSRGSTCMVFRCILLRQMAQIWQFIEERSSPILR